MSIAFPTDEQVLQHIRQSYEAVDTIELTPGAQLGRSSNSLFDNEFKRVFDLATQKKEDGSWTRFRGLAIYLKADPNSEWAFSRLFIFDNTVETCGIPKVEPSLAVQMSLESMKASPSEWGLDSAYHLYRVDVSAESIHMRHSNEFWCDVEFFKAADSNSQGDLADIAKMKMIYIARFKRAAAEQAWTLLELSFESDRTEMSGVLFSQIPYEKRKALKKVSQDFASCFGPEDHLKEEMESAGKIQLPGIEILDQWCAVIMREQPMFFELNQAYSLNLFQLVADSVHLSEEGLLSFDALMECGAQVDNGKGDLTADMAKVRKRFNVTYRHQEGTNWSLVGVKPVGSPEILGYFKQNIPLSDFAQIPTVDRKLRGQ